jgi:hypothetical protein
VIERFPFRIHTVRQWPRVPGQVSLARRGFGTTACLHQTTHAPP